MAQADAERFLRDVARELAGGRFDAAVDLAVHTLGEQGSPEDRAGLCVWLNAALQVECRLSSPDSLEVSLVVASRLGALRAVARFMGELGQAMTPRIDNGANVAEAAAAVLGPLLVTTPSQ